MFPTPPTSLHLLWIHDRARGTGGAERYITEVAPALRSAGIRSSLLYEPGFSEPAFLEAFDQAWPALDLPSQLRRLRPDLIYLHRQPQGLKLETLLESGIPTLRFFHDHQLFCLREHKYTALSQETCTRPLGGHCYRCPGFIVRQGQGLGLRTLGQQRAEIAQNQRLDHAVVASDYMAGHLREHGFDPARIATLPLFASPVKTTGRAEVGHFVFVGQLVTGKGLDLLLKALAEVPGARLSVAGSGRQAERYHSLSRQLGLSERVDFLGQVDPAELPALLARATAVVVPSRAPETFALTGIEAMAAGRAVIASDVGGVHAWLRPGLNGLLFASGHIQALAESLRTLTQHPELAIAMGQQGQLLWRNRFQREHHLQGLIPLLQKVAHPHTHQEETSA
ncbi:MAG: glycosyltransferase family 4 protein [Candidatus Sericytochromatia bacterium]